ncbi:uncharacterized protein KY384_004870 [Bacidia gigantensis]|uniref:uncharacterized protein n=1 Tax=Bacidia gigantensis TaxID=2732470 RepID=UPI001D04D757|nr:uncharacterized protein KY384_004870 [Bacidia gigantensis]KAG8530368.1 hypothetical protein KY384_004870 [Bacidia gigantensis]
MLAQQTRFSPSRGIKNPLLQLLDVAMSLSFAFIRIASRTTSQNILDFETPHALRIHISSLSSPNFASSYSLGSIGLLDGSISYLYSSRALSSLASKSNQIGLRSLIHGYRQSLELKQPDQASSWEVWYQGKRIDRKDTLLYGRLYLPRSTLEALYMRRLSPKTQLKVSCVSDSRLPNGGTILAHLQHDAAKHSTEYLYSTDSALLGIKTLYNFGYEREINSMRPNEGLDFTHATGGSTPTATTGDRLLKANGRLSAGAEIYYGLLNKSGGLSAGLRFITLPSHPGFPYTMTCTLNPLMGNLSSSYSVLANRRLSFGTRFDFNVYSYESDIQIGVQQWLRKKTEASGNLSWAREKMDLADQSNLEDEALSGCVKARMDQRGSVALLWEGRFKDLLYSCGTTLDLRNRNNMIKSFGIELQYSS